MPREPRCEYSRGKSAIRQMFAASSRTTTMGASRRPPRRSAATTPARMTASVKAATSGAEEPPPSFDIRYSVSRVPGSRGGRNSSTSQRFGGVTQAVICGLFRQRAATRAVKYTEPEKRIEVRVRKAGASVLVDVQDNGFGIAPKDQRRVFERFYRSDDLLARQTEGTGLGLSIARRIVEAHHGRLTLKSEVGRGSVFTVSLPAVVSPTTSRATVKEHLA